jgi:hypothetical protein
MLFSARARHRMHNRLAISRHLVVASLIGALLTSIALVASAPPAFAAKTRLCSGEQFGLSTNGYYLNENLEIDVPAGNTLRIEGTVLVNAPRTSTLYDTNFTIVSATPSKAPI